MVWIGDIWMEVAQGWCYELMPHIEPELGRIWIVGCAKIRWHGEPDRRCIAVFCWRHVSVPSWTGGLNQSQVEVFYDQRCSDRWHGGLV
jgi:hypothetical protein